MKISNYLKNDSIYLQKKDILYLEKVFNTSFIPKDEEKDYKDNDFILIENKEKVDLIKSRDEILEFKKFLSMTREELEQRMDDAEQLKYIVEKKKAPESEILRYSYEYKSAIDEFLEKGRGSLSFDVPLTLDMLNSYLFYETNDTYYTASTTMPSTYEVGRIDGKIVEIDREDLYYYNKGLIYSIIDVKNLKLYYLKNNIMDYHNDYDEILGIKLNNYIDMEIYNIKGQDAQNDGIDYYTYKFNEEKGKEIKEILNKSEIWNQEKLDNEILDCFEYNSEIFSIKNGYYCYKNVYKTNNSYKNVNADKKETGYEVGVYDCDKDVLYYYWLSY